MKVFPHQNTQRIVIDPGEYYVTNKPEVISTLLGSCVSACLYDPVKRIVGMNHFLLAYQHHSHGRSIIEADEARYGLFAMELMINAMLKLGANKQKLQAKCFGGGNVLHVKTDLKNKTVGEVNVEFIKAYLAKENIPMVASNLGGNIGRTVYFMAEDFSVYVKPITISQMAPLEIEERRYWQKNLQQQKREQKSHADFW